MKKLFPIKNVKMARRLTFTYFSIISFVIILIHFSVYYTTFESIEKSLAKDRFNEVRPHAQELIADGKNTMVKVSPHIEVYRSAEFLPDIFSSVPSIPFDEAFEIHIELNGTQDVFYMKTKMQVAGQQQEVWLLNHKDVHEFNRDELFLSLKFQLLISIALLGISLLLVQRVSSLLTEPMFQLASQLSKRSPDDHSPMPAPAGIITQELEVLLNSINQNQKKITELIARERAFNQHASHELRTPLMVIKGALSLLKETDANEFSNKQYLRIHQACEEINEFVATLLTLSQEEAIDNPYYELQQEHIESIIQQYEYLLDDKPIQVALSFERKTQTHIPLSVIKILLGNIIKNSFIYTEQGTVSVEITQHHIKVTDTGIGLHSSEDNQQGFGLGLVIVADICRKYGLTFNLNDNLPQGCIAEIAL